MLLLLPHHPLSPLLLLHYQPLLLLHVGDLPLSLGCLTPHVFTLGARLVTLGADALIGALQGLEGVEEGVVFLDLVDKLVLKVQDALGRPRVVDCLEL